jgi:hypothetical protein
LSILVPSLPLSVAGDLADFSRVYSHSGAFLAINFGPEVPAISGPWITPRGGTVLPLFLADNVASFAQ